MRRLIEWLKKIGRSYLRISRAKAVEMLEWEAAEMEHVFALLTLSTMIGLPAPPLPITLELLPDLEKELHLLLQRVDTAHAPLSELFSTLDVG